MMDDDLPSIGDDPFQPQSIKFPKRSFGEKKPVLSSNQHGLCGCGATVFTVH